MPTRKDKTNVAPIYREQVFIPASGATLIKQKARPKVNGRPVNSGAIEIVSPEFDLLTGVRGIANIIKPKINKSIISSDYYNPAISELDNFVNQGIKMGRAYFNHPVVKNTLEHNRQLYKRIIGKPQNMIYIDKTGKKVLAKERGELLNNAVSKSINYKFDKLPEGEAGTYSRNADMSGNITIAEGLAPNITKNSAFHETLHHGAYGNYDGIIYDLKAEKLFPNNAYLSAGHEAAANTAEVGRDMGLAIGQKYPGMAAFKNMLDNLPKPYYKDVVIKNAKLETPRDYKRFWDALTGKYFTTAGAATGLNLTNTDKMKCGGRRKAQLGLDIREGGIAIPIAPNMYYMNGRSHNEGGIGIGPNNKNGLEVEGGEVVKVGKNDVKVFSSVPLLRGVSPAQLVMGGANPNKVFKAQEDFKDRNRINDDGTVYKTGGIYIRPSKRGTFTAAAKKRGMGIQEFASKVLANKEDYSSAMVKKANFARNASRWKKEYGGNMIYEINGNVKNGLMSARPKAQHGKEKKINEDTKIGDDGLIYKRDARGEWWTDGTTYQNSKYYMREQSVQRWGKRSTGEVIKPKVQTQFLPEVVVTNKAPKSKGINLSNLEENYMTGQRRSANLHLVPNFVEEVNKDKKIVNSKASSTPRRDKTTSASSATSRGTAKVESPKPPTATNPMEARYSSRVQKGQVQEVTKPKENYQITNKVTADQVRYGRSSNFGKSINQSQPSTGGGTQPKDGRWIGQYKPITASDWIGLGSNLAGSIASYFMTKNAINKMPDPIKPIMAQAAKLKTRYNVDPQLTNIREAEQMNRAAIRRNTQSSNVSLAREQRLMNEARGVRNQLYGQKENIETQLINQDKLNRQSVMRDNIKAYNEYINRLTATRQGQNQLRISNINNLLSGLTGSVNNILGTIESRRATNNTLRAIAAANPNVDARLIGGFDYYIDPITKRKYNKNQQYVGTING